MSSIWGTRRNRANHVPTPRHHDDALFDDVGSADKPGQAGHRWLVGNQAAVTAWLAAAPPHSLGAVPGHARLRGPFTAAGTLMRGLGPDMVANHTDLIRRYGTEILAAAPDLAWILGPARPAGHHPHDRARQVAEKLSALTLAYAAELGPRQTLAVLDVDALDSTDATWLAVLLAQADPERLQIVVAGASGAVPGPLGRALASHAVRTDIASRRVPKPLGAPPSPRFLARAYVATECLSDDAGLRAAYEGLDPVERADLHNTRAARLEVLGEPSLRLGSIAYHRERGNVPGAGVSALSYAVTECFRAGWYEAAVAFGDRLRALLSTEGGAFTIPAGA